MFHISGGHYNGAVNCGSLLLQTDIQEAPIISWKKANPEKYYALMMVDFDGNANGSWPDPVPSGENSPVRHWVVGNISGKLLKYSGYEESKNRNKVRILQSYRAPHIPVVSDRYGVFIFEQNKIINFSNLPYKITNFDYMQFITRYQLGNYKAANYFVAIYTSKSPFLGENFSGNVPLLNWHKNYGNGQLTPFKSN